MIHLENWSFKLNVILKLWKSQRKLNVDGHEVKRIRKKGKKEFGNCIAFEIVVVELMRIK